ncbi:hypothetical protein [Halalkalibacter urbisdiaboli]|uniref:hypothetical protein n=1 Tax=Halalkalibacter urbisdiaboli TaxID=1960589 RepID=UPI001FDA1702|nr:hypothetical protein [Halalkalibacter urbisdiaboli]
MIALILTKITDKTLATNQDLSFNQRIGLPIEVFCSKKLETVAFGQIESFGDTYIQVNGTRYCRESYLFFGQPNLTA